MSEDDLDYWLFRASLGQDLADAYCQLLQRYQRDGTWRTHVLKHSNTRDMIAHGLVSVEGVDDAGTPRVVVVTKRGEAFLAEMG